MAPSEDVLLSTLEYGTAGPGGRPLTLHLLRPYPLPASPLPVIVGVHGGAFRSGSKDAYLLRLLPFARRGYACASVEYRLSGEATWPAQIRDCAAAVRYLRGHAGELGLDGERIGAWGSSAGGHLVTMLGVRGDDSPEEDFPGERPPAGERAPAGDGATTERGRGVSGAVQAVCDWFGPSDLLRMTAQPSSIDHSGPASPEGRLLGGAVADLPEAARDASPIAHVDGNGTVPPFLIVHGTEDPLIPYAQSVSLYEALSGGEVTLVTLPGAKHGGPEFEHPATMRRVHDFFDRHLRAGREVAPWAPEPAVPGRDPGPAPETAVVASGAWHNPGTVPPLTTHRVLESAAAGGPVSYALYLPPGYESAGDAARRYPVVYWLHGMRGGPWRGARFVAMLDEAIRAGIAPPALAVLPTGGPMSMYVDARDGSWPVETVIVGELVGHVDATYRTVASREGRCIEGQSMGGFGAARFGFGHPERFGAVSISAGALISLGRERSGPRFRAVWGEDAAYFEATNPRTIVRRNADRIRALGQHVRLFVGDQDRLLEASRTFHELLDELGIAHELTIVPGAGHGYDEKMDRLGVGHFAWFARVFAPLAAGALRPGQPGQPAPVPAAPA